MAKRRPSLKSKKARGSPPAVEELLFQVGFWRESAKLIPDQHKRKAARDAEVQQRMEKRNERRRMAEIGAKDRDRDALARLIKRVIKSFSVPLPKPLHLAVMKRLGELDDERILRPSSRETDYLLATAAGLAVRWQHGPKVVETPERNISSRISRIKRHQSLR